MNRGRGRSRRRPPRGSRRWPAPAAPADRTSSGCRRPSSPPPPRRGSKGFAEHPAVPTGFVRPPPPRPAPAHPGRPRQEARWLQRS
jgi:hypothetical protein